jgi:hypothetical protein
MQAVRWLCDALERVIAGQAADMAFENGSPSAATP